MDSQKAINLSPEVIEEMINKTRDVMKNSYSPYSKFKVGSTVLTESGEMISGTNVENASYGLCCCAERNAIFAAIAKGHRKFQAIFLSTDIEEDFKWPCGACAQVCLEFGSDWLAVSIKPNREICVKRVGDFLPFGFQPQDLFKYQAQINK